MDDKVEVVLSFLNRKKVRASYGALKGLLGYSESDMPPWEELLGSLRPEASWIVRADTGLPRGYPYFPLVTLDPKPPPLGRPRPVQPRRFSPAPPSAEYRRAAQARPGLGSSVLNWTRLFRLLRIRRRLNGRRFICIVFGLENAAYFTFHGIDYGPERAVHLPFHGCPTAICGIFVVFRNIKQGIQSHSSPTSLEHRQVSVDPANIDQDQCLRVVDAQGLEPWTR